MSVGLIKYLHLISGVALIVFFALTGQYMKHQLDLPNSEFDAQRMMYRASHIYLLLAGIINMALGCFWVAFQNRFARFVQISGSVLLLGAQGLFVTAFITEPAVLSAERPYTWLACVGSLSGVGLLFVASLTDQLRHKPSANMSHAD